MKQAAREEEAEAEDMDRFIREQNEAEDAEKNQGRGRGRGRGKGNGRGAAAKPKKQDAARETEDVDPEKEKTPEKKGDEKPRKNDSKRKHRAVVSPSQKNLMMMKRLKALKSRENLSPEDGQRCLAAELDEAADTEEKGDDAPRTPRRKRAASPEGKDGKAKKVKPADEDSEAKPKKKYQYPRGSPRKIKKITDRGRVEELEIQENCKLETQIISVWGKFFIQHALTHQVSKFLTSFWVGFVRRGGLYFISKNGARTQPKKKRLNFLS